MMQTNGMRRAAALFGLAGLLVAAIGGCGGGGNSGPGPDPTPSPGSPVGTRARWTVLAYMNAANDLQPDALNNLAQMAAVGSDSNVNIVVQLKQSACYDSSGAVVGGCTLSFTGTHRYYIKPHAAADVTAIGNGNTTSLENTGERLADPATNTTVGSTSTSDMGDYRTLSDFVTWGSKNFPSDHLAVVVWDHGSGWRDVQGYSRAKSPRTRVQTNIRKRAVSFDEQTQHAIDTWQLSQGLTGANRAIDDLVIDCSLEQMLEVAFEVRQNATVTIGSEDSPPGPGYPYDKWLAALKTSGTNAQDLGTSIVNTFLTRYINDPTYDTTGNGDPFGNVTQSMIDSSKLDNVASKLDALGGVLRTHLTDKADLIAFARTNAQFYEQSQSSYYNDNKDLYDYARLLSIGGQGISAPSADIQQAATALMTALKGSLTTVQGASTDGAILLNGHGNVQQPNSNGLAIYVPGPGAGNYRSTYTNLALAKAAPNWVSFLTSQPQ